jgi:hypothetical protein
MTENPPGEITVTGKVIVYQQWIKTYSFLTYYMSTVAVFKISFTLDLVNLPTGVHEVLFNGTGLKIS